MTSEKRTRLIEHLKYIRSIGADYIITDEDADEIIKALEQEPCEDTISREDALMALTGEWSEPTDELIHQFIRRIKNLPPVQPEIVRCKDCKHREAKNGFCEGRGWPMQLVPDDGFCEKGERSD